MGRQASKYHKANATIRLLDLRNNMIGDRGAAALADALKALLVMCFPVARATCSCGHPISGSVSFVARKVHGLMTMHNVREAVWCAS